MPSKRILKKNVKKMVSDVIESAYDIQFFDAKKTDATEKLINEVADYNDEILNKISTSKSNADFKGLHDDIQERANDFYTKLNGLG